MEAATARHLAALRLQRDWGADEALLPAPRDRRRDAAMPPPSPPARPAPAPVVRVAPPASPPGDPVLRARTLAGAAASLAEWRAALAGSDGAGLAATATSLVLPDGEPGAGLVLVGDVPGAEEDVSGVAFSGPAGRLLDRMLASIGLDRRRALLTTVIPWRPPGGRPPSETEIACCLPFLHRLLALLAPRRVVPLGALPTRLLLDRREPISRLRGRWADASIPGLPAPVPVLPMLHPSQLIARPDTKALAWTDLRLLHRTLAQNDKFVKQERAIDV